MTNDQIVNAQALLIKHLGSLSLPQLNAIQDDLSEHYLGLQCVIPEISTVLVMYGEKDYINAHLKKHETYTVSWEDFTNTEEFTDLKNYPVSAVSEALVDLMYTFSDGSDPVTVLPWVEEVRVLQRDNEFSGVSAQFFPTVAITNEKSGFSLLVRIAPVNTKGDDNE